MHDITGKVYKYELAQTAQHTPTSELDSAYDV